jgi:hypothetical protein
MNDTANNTIGNIRRADLGPVNDDDVERAIVTEIYTCVYDEPLVLSGQLGQLSVVRCTLHAGPITASWMASVGPFSVSAEDWDTGRRQARAGAIEVLRKQLGEEMVKVDLTEPSALAQSAEAATALGAACSSGAGRPTPAHEGAGVAWNTPQRTTLVSGGASSSFGYANAGETPEASCRAVDPGPPVLVPRGSIEQVLDGEVRREIIEQTDSTRITHYPRIRPYEEDGRAEAFTARTEVRSRFGLHAFEVTVDDPDKVRADAAVLSAKMAARQQLRDALNDELIEKPEGSPPQ